MACHPTLSVAARTALTLRLVGGLTTAEIAWAYLEPEATVKQRILRAKRAISKAGVPSEVPEGEDRAARLGSVLEVVYLIFNEGYAATSGADWTRPALCAAALRLGRVLAELAPDEAEVHGLAALMEIQSSRLQARRGPDGEPVLLHEQAPDFTAGVSPARRDHERDLEGLRQDRWRDLRRDRKIGDETLDGASADRETVRETANEAGKTAGDTSARTARPPARLSARLRQPARPPA